jgi:hypothetical protein
MVSALATCLALAGPARAGIYNTIPNEQLAGPMSLAQFRQVYGYYMSLFNPQLPARPLYLEALARLERREKEPGGLSPDDRINLSSYYMRLRQPEKAVSVLAPLDTPEQRNFMVLANLSMAHFLSRRMERAIDYADRALKAWPSEWPGLSRLQLSWFYRVETEFAHLLRLRHREEVLQPGKTGQSLDNLFTGVHFVGPSGKYEAGGMDPKEYARLPGDHLAVVEQLLVWMPDDPQLAWLLAELLNANGATIDAGDLMYNLSFNLGYRPKELSDHLRVLQEGRAAAVAWSARMASSDEQYRLLWMLAPRGATAPGALPIANEAGWAVTLGMMRQPPRPTEDKGSTTKPPPAPTPAPAPWMPDVRHVVVSFLAGVAITLLVAMQVRELRRRRQTPATTAKE